MKINKLLWIRTILVILCSAGVGVTSALFVYEKTMWGCFITAFSMITFIIVAILDKKLYGK
jgi:hypothetical protein